MRAALPWWVKAVLNERLADLSDYSGHITDVDIALWRGAYQLVDLDIVKIEDNIPVPFFRVEQIDLAVSWRALWRGSVVAEATFNQPQLNFVDAPNQAGQAGARTDWQRTLQQLAPVRINELVIVGGYVHFCNFGSKPPVNVRITGIDGTIRDINNLAEAYGKFDFEKGEDYFLMELAAQGGQLNGYARPLLDDVEIVGLKEDLNEGPLSAAWEVVVGMLGVIFRDQQEDRIGSQIEIHGDLDSQDVSAWQALVSIPHNGFVDAYEARFGREK